MDPLLSPLPRRFYHRPVLHVARQLLGKLLVRRVGGDLLVGRIVETEAYGGLLDPASHSYRGWTPRCRSMFGPVGHAYVYFTYGNHYCMNVVAGSRRHAAAVLLRAVEPQRGQATMRRLRAGSGPGILADKLARGEADRQLTNGPGKLAQAMQIGASQDGSDLMATDQLWIAGSRGSVRDVRWTVRVGLGRNPAAAWVWRCVDNRSSHTTPAARNWESFAGPTPTLREARILDAKTRKETEQRGSRSVPRPSSADAGVVE